MVCMSGGKTQEINVRGKTLAKERERSHALVNSGRKKELNWHLKYYPKEEFIASSYENKACGAFYMSVLKCMQAKRKSGDQRN